MGFFKEQHLFEAKDALVDSAHPCIIPILAVCLDSLNGNERSISEAQRQVLDEMFSLPGSDDLQWYVPLGAARGASSRTGRWRGDKANYIGRSLQRMEKSLRDAGAYTQDGKKKILSDDANDIILGQVRKQNPPVHTPIPVWPLAIWYYKDAEVDSLDQAVDDFWGQFGLDRLNKVFDKDSIPEAVRNEKLSLSKIDLANVVRDLEPRPTETSDDASSSSVEEGGVDEILGIRLNSFGEKENGGKPVQLLLHGGPGSGKSYRLNEYSKKAHYTLRIVVHPETRYADFVGGLRPITIWKKESPAPTFIGLQAPCPGEPRVIYQFSPGPLLQALYLACFEPERSVVLIVEELSRGNPAQIFGDILQLLDRADTDVDGIPAGASLYSIDPKPDVRSWLIENGVVAYENLDPIGKVRLPSNLYIWATMNRADQNARQLDAAFLRRWAREHCSWKQENAEWDDIEIIYGGKPRTWGQLRFHINQKLVQVGGVPEDKFIGPYFIPRSRLEDPEYIFEDLWGYLWHEVLKSRAPEFFGVDTLADLEDYWNSGQGAPLGELD